jgi:predicted nucleotidyltransferase
MHKDLVIAFEKMVDILQKDERCKGGWHFGSISRGQEDIYSDYDPVFLIADKDFEQFAADVPKIFSRISDELLIFWGEDFNDNYFKNFCSIVRLGDNLHQLDIFMINYDHPETWLCKMHCQGCAKKDIIFDRTGETKKILENGYRIENYMPNLTRIIDTYWFHTVMLIKYFKRGDLFKILKNMNILFHSHVDLLLSQYDTMDWGSWESKVKHCVPLDKQEHLKIYFTKANMAELEKAVIKGIGLFKNDSDEICKEKGINYSKKNGNEIIKYFNNNIC